MLEAVPVGVERRVREPVRTREVDDDGVGRSLHPSRPLVIEAPEDELRAGTGGVRIRDERRNVAVQARVESACRPAGKRVRAKGDELELRVREDAVERLLA
jgi:hypothetical protein